MGISAADRRRMIGMVAMTSVVLIASLLVPVRGAVAAVTAYGYYRAPWSDVIREVGTDGSARALTFAEWQGAGAPTPRIAPVRYVKNPWSTTVYGLITWPHEDGDTAVDQVVVLSREKYARAGKPRVEQVGDVPGTDYFTWSSNSSEIFARTPDRRDHKLTYREWTSAGSPQPRTSKAGYYRAAWSNDIHKVSTTGRAVRLTAAQWSAAGAPRPAIAPTTYAKTPWAPTIYALLTWPTGPADTAVDMVVPLGWSEYSRAGRPAVKTQTRIPGDSFVKYTVGQTVFHVVGGVVTPLTGAQWASAGSPPPQLRTAPSPTYIRGILIVNKSLPIPPSFGNGLRPETVSAFAAMRGAAASSGLNLYISSGYRSYGTQQGLYGRFVAAEGVAGADTHSARPGHSEHQTGLAIDINTVHASFANTPEGRWVAANAHVFGFIVRYPPGKQGITGYVHEPWHLRYVGVEAATVLHTRGLTLEEYLGVPSRYS